jgi:hypothetical protein
VPKRLFLLKYFYNTPILLKTGKKKKEKEKKRKVFKVGEK